MGQYRFPDLVLTQQNTSKEKKHLRFLLLQTIFSAAAGLFIFTLQGRVSATKLGL